jgi:hypothetical protein
VRDILVAADYRVVLQQFDFKNHNFMERMDSALASGAQVIAILSNDYLASEYCTAEWYHPLIGDPLNKLGRLIVLRVAECAPRGLLRGIAYCDLVGLRENPALLCGGSPASSSTRRTSALRPASRAASAT